MVAPWWLLTFTLLLRGCAGDEWPPPPPMQQCSGPNRALVNTADGPVCGLNTPTNQRFLGIPYAEPPVGERRWKQPVKKVPWGAAGIDATHYGADCVQLGPAWPSLGNLTTTSEDCLTLNVIVPRVPHGTKALPVVVFIPAGALQWGSGNDAENNGSAVGVGPGWRSTILVTLNYRLGVLGFLFSKQLRQERGVGAGLYGVLDQQLAMHWVQENIGAFGGNADAVTLFGESAGATSVSTHMAMPSSWGLFHRAAIDSGAFNTWTNKTQEQAQATFEQLARNIGCGGGGNHTSTAAAADTVACMAAKDALTLVNASDPYYGNGTACMYHICPNQATSLPHGESLTGTLFGPVTDGELLPVSAIEQLHRGQLAPGVAVLLGTNRDEGSLFVDCVIRNEVDFTNWATRNFGLEVAQALPQFYNMSRYPDWWFAATRVAGDFSLICPTRRAARQLAARPGTGSAVYAYSFAHIPQQPFNRPDPPCDLMSPPRLIPRVDCSG